METTKQAPKAVSVVLTSKEGAALAFLRTSPGGWAANTEIRQLIVREAAKRGWPG